MQWEKQKKAEALKSGSTGSPDISKQCRGPKIYRKVEQGRWKIS